MLNSLTSTLDVHNEVCRFSALRTASPFVTGANQYFTFSHFDLYLLLIVYR